MVIGWSCGWTSSSAAAAAEADAADDVDEVEGIAVAVFSVDSAESVEELTAAEAGWAVDCAAADDEVDADAAAEFDALLVELLEVAAAAAAAAADDSRWSSLLARILRLRGCSSWWLLWEADGVSLADDDEEAAEDVDAGDGALLTAPVESPPASAADVVVVRVAVAAAEAPALLELCFAVGADVVDAFAVPEAAVSAAVAS